MGRQPWGETRRPVATLQSFFICTDGPAYTFKFKNWIGHDYALNQEPFGVGDGATTSFQLIKTYGREWGVNLKTRTITKPNPAGMVILLDGEPVDPAHVAIDHLTGMVTLATPPAVGSVVSVTGEYWNVARLDTQQFLGKMESYNAYTWGNVPIVEVLT